MKTILTISFLILSIASFLYAQNNTLIEGKVADESNNPIPYVNIFLQNTTDGTMSDDDGSFRFKTKVKGKAVLIASMLGYEKFSKEIEVGSIKEISINISLNANSIELGNAIITASSYGSEKEKGLVISRMDVLTTPGGATDIYQSLKTMPGVTQVSESAELYVRGGDPLETTTLINQSAVYHSSTFESAYGGIFSVVDQSAVKSLYFTSGGFSAKYGNALSGVLDIETRDLPQDTHANIGLSLANGSLTAEIAIDSSKLGLYFDARQTFTSPIFWFNGGSDRMVVAPISKNFTGGIVYNYSKTGRLKFFNIYADDEQGVKVDRAEYNGVFDGNTKNIFLNLQNSSLLPGNIVMKNSISYNKYSNLWLLGILDMLKTDYVYSFRSDFEMMPAQSIKILAGGEFENRRINYTGRIPQEDYDIMPGAKSKVIDADFMGSHYGVYAELQSAGILGLKNLSLTAGLRYDNVIDLALGWTDPRLGLSYKIGDKSILRFGWGIFRQLPDARLFSPVDGNPDLKAMQAIHFITSYEYNIDDQNSFRIEAYSKKYSKLPRENTMLNYDNSGYGFANGVDVIYKGDFPLGITGWLSYGFINTKRLWMDYDNLTNSSSDITNNFALVAKYNLSEVFQLGLTAKYATGRPYTPVIASAFRDDLHVYEPVYATTNSSRFPDYKRIDMRLTYFGKLLGSYNFIAYLEGINIFNFTNIFGYSYSPDYKETKKINSYFGRRMLVMGFTVSVL